MVFEFPGITILWVFGGLSILVLVKDILFLPARAEAYLKYLWVYFLIFTSAELISFGVSIWILAIVSFVALREYFSLLAIRLQDRWGLWGGAGQLPRCLPHWSGRSPRWRR